MGSKKSSAGSKKQRKDHNDKKEGNISGLDGAAQKPAPPSSLSSKILDMKFMKKANVQQEAEKQAETTKKIHDSSRWKLTFQSEDKPIAKKHTTVNFSELNDDNDDEIKGRRSWGNFNNNISEKEEPSGNRTSDDEDMPETNERVSEDKEATLKRKKSSNDKKKKKQKK
jgi:hypothetical protein